MIFHRYSLIKTPRSSTSLSLSWHLPRNVQTTLKDWRSDPPIFETLIKLSVSRTQRLLESEGELEREVCDGSSPHRNRGVSSQKESNETLDLNGGLVDEGFLRMPNPPRRTLSSTLRKDLTGRIDRTGEGNHRGSYSGWKGLKLREYSNRHTWGAFFRSILEWDWDLAGSLERMYELRIENEYQGAAPTIPTASLTNGRLDAVLDIPEETVEEVRIAYRSSTGEVVYRTFRVVDLGFANPATSRGAVSQKAGSTTPETNP